MSAWFASVRARDPFWYRLVEVSYAVAVVGSNIVADWIEDSVTAMWARVHKH